MNAIAHRDYSIAGTQIDIDIFADRIEVKSPGGWLLSKKPSQYALDKIPSKRRNDSISACFELCGLMERSGTGFEKIANFYKAYPQTMPVLEDFGDFFCITLFDLLYVKTGFDEQGAVEAPELEAEQQLVLMLCAQGPKSRKELQEATGIKSRSYFMRKVLQPMLEKDLIEAVSPKNSPNQRYKSKNGVGAD
ncbi:MAG: ATP-binding protein [Bacilli bacterium]|nr:ATP-binding protein [Bacilli bacterium]